MNLNVSLALIGIFIILAGASFEKPDMSRDNYKLLSPIMCYDHKRWPIYGDPRLKGYDDKCVYTVESFNILQALPLDTLSTNPDCKQSNICLAACNNSRCLSIGSVSHLFSYKASWTLRFVVFGSIYTGCVLAFVIIVYFSYRSRIHFIKYKTFLDESADESDSGFDSDVEEGSAEPMKPSDPLSESFYSQSDMRSQKSINSVKVALPQKRKSNI